MRRRFAEAIAAVLICVLVLAGAEPYARDLVAARVTEARVASLLAGHPELRVAEVRAAPFGGALLLRGVVWRKNDVRVAIGRLRLPLPRRASWLATAAAEPATPPAAPAPPFPAPPSPAPPAPAPPSPAPAAGTIRADDVVVTQGATTVRMKRIDLAGTTLSNADLAALLDPKAPDSLEARLRKLTATAVVIPEIAIDDSTPGSERHALLRQVLLADVRAGKAAAVSAAETSIALTDGQAVVNGTTGAIEASGVDLAQVAHVVRGPRKSDAEPVQPLFAKAVINAPRFASATQDAGLSANAITATNVSGRPLAAAALPVADATMLSPGAMTLLGDIAGSFSIGGLDVDGFASHGKAAGEETRLSATQARLEALGDGRIGGASLRGLHLDGTYAKLSIATAEVGRIELPAPGGDARLSARPSQLDLGQVSVEITPRDRPGAAALRFTIDRVAVAQSGGRTAIPASGSVTLSNLAFDLPPDGALTHALYAMGYHHVTLAATLASSYDAGAQEMTVNRLSVSEPTMGSIEIALRLANVSPGLLSPDAETAQASAVAVLAKSVDLKIVNTGLFEKAIAYKAQLDGVSVADERTFGVDYFAHTLPAMLGDGPGAKAIGGAVAKFIADPKSLHVSVASSEGLGVGSVGMLADPGALLDSLDIHASADE